jgi:hypothetical protein
MSTTTNLRVGPLEGAAGKRVVVKVRRPGSSVTAAIAVTLGQWMVVLRLLPFQVNVYRAGCRLRAS